jgi:MscS family membrane protein
MINHRKFGGGLLSASFVLFCATACAQPGSSSVAAQPEAPQDVLGRTTPRGTVLGFLLAARKADNEIAARYLNTDLKGESAALLAHKLYVVLNRRLAVELRQLSDRPEGSSPLLTNLDEDLIGTIASDGGNVDIVVERVDRGKGRFLWLFSPKTLDAVPTLFEEVDAIPIDSFIPEFLLETRIAGMALFGWLALLVGLPAFYVFAALLNRLLSYLAGSVRRRVHRNADLSNPEILPRAVRLLILALAIRWAMSKAALPLLMRVFWSSTATVITIAAWVWMLILLNGVAESFLQRRLVRLNQGGATSILRLGRRTVDVLLLFVGILVGLHHFGVNLTAVLAGLGVGGVAIALGAQKTLENVIGGISVIFDRSVGVGDFVKVADKEGFVEHIGLRSTRLRTLDRTLVSIPNGQLASVSLEDISIRDKFWLHHTLRLRSDTSAPMMRAILKGVQTHLEQHARVEPGSVRVRFLGFGTSSLDVEISAYVLSSDWSQFLEIQQDLLLDVMEIVQAAGAGIAYPSQTLFLARSNPLKAADGEPRCAAPLRTSA